MDHKELVEKAKEAIDSVFGDTSVSPEQTADSLQELVEEIEMKLSSLPQDA